MVTFYFKMLNLTTSPSFQFVYLFLFVTVFGKLLVRPKKKVKFLLTSYKEGGSHNEMKELS